MNWYIKVLNNYAQFNGRARRSEYWYFVLFNVLFAFIAMGLDNILGTTFEMGYGVTSPYGYVYVIYGLAVFIPGLAVSVRRLHDVGKSGWMFLICLIPIVGAIWLLVLLFTESQAQTNKWGENPKINNPNNEIS